MIYMIAEDGQTILLIEPTNLLKLKDGRPMHSPDNKIIVAYTPDMVWTIDALKGAMDNGKVDVNMLIAILQEAKKRPEVVR